MKIRLGTKAFQKATRVVICCCVCMTDDLDTTESQTGCLMQKKQKIKIKKNKKGFEA